MGLLLLHTQSAARVYSLTHTRGGVCTPLLWEIEFTVPFKVWKKPSVLFLNCKRWVMI